jgi:hypothetical protein
MTTTECQRLPEANQESVTLDVTGILIREAHFPAWVASTQLAGTLLDLDAPQRKIVIDQIRERASAHPTPPVESHSFTADLAGLLKETFTFPPLDRERLHCEPCMREDNEKMMLALIGSTSPLGPASRVLRLGELPEFGPLISEAGMNSDVYAYGANQVVKFVRYGEEAAKLLHDSIRKLAEDPRLRDIVLPVRMLQEGGSHLLQERIPITYLKPDMQPKLDELVGVAREILHIPGGPDRSIYVGKFRLLIDDQLTNITQDLQWYDPVYLSIKQAER